jgi:regulator of protease activity HflC (stomatin/prohibitin superfamily)
MSQERQVRIASGLLTLFALLILLGLDVWWFIEAAQRGAALEMIGAATASVVLIVLLAGFFQVEPNQGVVLTLFGRYIGTCRDPGLRWANPFYAKKKISLRVRNFESGKLKVNELEGSPIEIAAVVVWQVVDTWEASFEVDNYENFVHIQSESALRQMATRYPYDLHEGVELALRSHGAEIAEQLKGEIQERLTTAGVMVIEARISHLAYAPEIAQAMLQRQQAGAIIAARARIVEGAVGMVHMALEQLKAGGQIEMDDERRAAMVSNLLVVLCSDRATQPVVNTGTLHTG